MKYIVAKVRLSEVQTKQITVPPWEIAILRAIHGDDVEELEEIEVDRDPPDAEDEYRRLATRYSANKDTPNSAVAAVFGTFEAGYDKLGKEIDKAVNDSGPTDGARKSRLDALTKRQKAEADGLKTKQATERKDLERDADRREKEQERRDGRDDEDDGRKLRDASTTLHRSPLAQAKAQPAPTEPATK